MLPSASARRERIDKLGCNAFENVDGRPDLTRPFDTSPVLAALSLASQPKGIQTYWPDKFNRESKRPAALTSLR
jgi:hypothetical protein